MKIVLIAVAMLMVSCSTVTPIKKENQENKDNKNGRTVVLIHGAFFDGKIWSHVQKYLESNGMSVIAPTLPGRDKNKNVDISDYAQFTCDLIPDNSVLVGHSQGGAVANEMIGKCPEKIAKIIYVAGLVPLNGEGPFDMMEKRDEKVFSKAVVFKKDRIEPKNKRGFIRAMAQDFDYKLNKAPNIYAEPTRVAKSVIKFVSEDFDGIPKAYIYTENDQIITPQTQKKLTDRVEFQETYSVVTGHLPMVTKPDAVADLILRSSSH